MKSSSLYPANPYIESLLISSGIFATTLPGVAEKSLIAHNANAKTINNFLFFINILLLIMPYTAQSLYFILQDFVCFIQGAKMNCL